MASLPFRLDQRPPASSADSSGAINRIAYQDPPPVDGSTSIRGSATEGTWADARAHAAARREAALETRLASGFASTLSVEQARAIFEAEALGAVEGGRAAIVRPESRARLVKLASGLGVKPFEAQLTIALVQERVRAGEVEPTATTPGPTAGWSAGGEERDDRARAEADAEATRLVVWAMVLGLGAAGVLVVLMAI